MNIFLTTDIFSDYLIISKLTEQLKNIDLSRCVILTTDRQQDKPFISFAIMNGLEFKVYNVKDYLTEQVIQKIADSIDYLIIFSDMGNWFYQRLFSMCDKTIYIDGEKLNIDDYKKYLSINYKKVITDKKNVRNRIDTFKAYQELVVNKLKTVRRVKIIINTMGLNRL